jgi:hypothetical protein
LTLTEGDHLVLKRAGKLVGTEEAYREFEAVTVSKAVVFDDKIFYVVLLKKVE